MPRDRDFPRAYSIDCNGVPRNILVFFGRELSMALVAILVSLARVTSFAEGVDLVLQVWGVYELVDGLIQTY